MTDYPLKDGMVILEIEGSKEVRVALGRWYLGPRLGDRSPGWMEFPCARDKVRVVVKETPKAWLTCMGRIFAFCRGQ